MSNVRRATWGLAATTLVWGSTFVVVRDLVAPPRDEPAFPPFLLLALRFAIASAILLAVLWVRGHRMTPAAWQRGAVLGVLVFAGFASQTIGLQYTTSARSAFITNVSLLLVPVFAWVAGRARPGASTAIGILVSMGGLWFLEFPWDLRAPTDPSVGSTAEEVMRSYYRGDLITLGCAVFFAIQILTTENFAPRTQLVPLVFAQFLTCTVVSFGASAMTGEFAEPIPTPGGFERTALEILYLGAACTAVCLLVQAWAQRYTTATRAALIFAMEPVFATLLAYAVRDEKLTAAQWVGASLVLLGILVTEVLPSTRPPHEDAVRPLAPPVYDNEIR